MWAPLRTITPTMVWASVALVTLFYSIGFHMSRWLSLTHVPTQKHLFFHAFDLTPVTSDSSWTLHDIMRRNNEPKIVRFRKLLDFPGLSDSPQGHFHAGQEDWNVSTSNLIIYNGIPRTGSSTIQMAIESLANSVSNGYTMSNVYSPDAHSWNAQEEATFVQSDHFSRGRPHMLTGHFYFVDVTRYGEAETPRWISFVRDPIERVVSMFYHGRNPKRWHNTLYKPPNDYFTKNFDACCLSHDPECQFEPGTYREQQLSYFCGNSPLCRQIGNPRALQEAKLNVERSYQFVGVVNDLPSSLQALQALIPEFFRNASMFLDIQTLSNESPPDYKPPHRAVHRKLRLKLNLEVEFYEFVQQRLKRQLGALSLPH